MSLAGHFTSLTTTIDGFRFCACRREEGYMLAIRYSYVSELEEHATSPGKRGQQLEDDCGGGIWLTSRQCGRTLHQDGPEPE